MGFRMATATTNGKPKRPKKYKTQAYVKWSGQEIVGLKRRPDGRHYAADEPSKTFGKDPADAVRKFRKWQSQRRRERIDLPETRPPSPATKRVLDHFHPDEPNDEIVYHHQPTADAFYDKMKELLDDEQGRVKLAQRTGYKQILWLDEIEEPPPPLTLAAVGEAYYGKPHVDPETKRRTFEGGREFNDPREKGWSFTVWQRFCKAVKPATTIEDVKPQHLRRFEQTIRTAKYRCKKTKRMRPYAEKTKSQMYNKIGSILREAWFLHEPHRAEIQRLRVEFRNVCKNGHNDEENSRPMSVEDFHTIYKAANNELWRALLLAMLNLAIHPNEATHVEKSKFDLRRKTYADKRKKKGKYGRVAMLWPETVAAIKAYQNVQRDNAVYQETEFMFLNSADKPFSKSGATYYFRETLKPRAEKSAGFKIAATLDGLRHGAQEAADEMETNPYHTDMLMGHKLPNAKGNYKRRIPSKTQKNVDAIREYYRIAELVVAPSTC